MTSLFFKAPQTVRHPHAIIILIEQKKHRRRSPRLLLRVSDLGLGFGKESRGRGGKVVAPLSPTMTVTAATPYPPAGFGREGVGDLGGERATPPPPPPSPPPTGSKREGDKGETWEGRVVSAATVIPFSRIWEWGGRKGKGAPPHPPLL